MPGIASPRRWCWSGRRRSASFVECVWQHGGDGRLAFLARGLRAADTRGQSAVRTNHTLPPCPLPGTTCCWTGPVTQAEQGTDDLVRAMADLTSTDHRA